MWPGITFVYVKGLLCLARHHWNGLEHDLKKTQYVDAPYTTIKIRSNIPWNVKIKKAKNAEFASNGPVNPVQLKHQKCQTGMNVISCQIFNIFSSLGLLFFISSDVGYFQANSHFFFTEKNVFHVSWEGEEKWRQEPLPFYLEVKPASVDCNNIRSS